MFQVLLALVDCERHGYGIMKEIKHNTEGQLRIGPGTLYRSLHQLLENGLIKESDARPDPTLDDERRRYYQLTVAGRIAAEVEASRLARLVQIARSKHLLLETRLYTVECAGGR